MNRRAAPLAWGLLAASLLVPGASRAEDTPRWEDLSPEKKSDLLGYYGDFKNKSPDDQRRMMEAYARIQAMPPDHLKLLRARLETLHNLSPKAREKLLRQWEFWKTLKPEQQKAYATMPPEQRKEFIKELLRQRQEASKSKSRDAHASGRGAGPNHDARPRR